MGGAVIGPFGRYELGTEVITIGRAPTNKLVIKEGQASGRHAEIRPEGNGYVLVDLGSTNGTSINGRRLQAQVPQELRGGDVITIGGASITVELAAAALPPTERAAPPAQGAYAPTERAGAPPAQAAYAPTERVGAPPNQPDYGAGTAYVPPPPPPPPPDQFTPYGGGGQGVATSYYSEPPPPPPPLPYTPPPAFGPPGINLGAAAATGAANRRRLQIIIGGVLAAVLVIVIIGVVVYNNSHSPESVTQSYYSNLESHDYNAVFAAFDSRLQVLANEQQWAAFFTCLDTTFGTISSFSTGQSSSSDTQANVQVNITRSRIPGYTEEVQLVKENGNWKIDRDNGIPENNC